MKNILKRLFSFATISALVASPLCADQLMKKLGAKESVKVSTTKMAASRQKGDLKSKGVRGLDRKRKHHSPFSVERLRASYPKTAMSTRAEAQSELPKIYGSVLYSDSWTTEALYGVYTIPTAAGQAFNPLFLTGDVTADYGAAVKDGVYYFNTYYVLYDFYEYFESYGFDIATGKQVYKADLSGDISLLCPGGMATDPLSGNIYGIAYTSDLSAQELVIMSYDGFKPKKTPIATLSQWFTAFAIDSNGQFYGIMEAFSGEGILCKIDRTNGEVTQIGPTGQFSVYPTGACIDPATNKMYWAVSPEEETGYLTEVNLNTGVASMVYMFPDSEEVSGMYIEAPESSAGAPGDCTNLEAQFGAESLSGKINYMAPATLFDGSSPSGNFDVTLLVNGAVYETTKNVIPGSSNSFDVTLPTAGNYVFTIYASNATGEGPKTGIMAWIGPDVPAATTPTARYNDGKIEITWLPVTEGINGGALDLTAVTYTVADSEGNILAQNLTGTSYSFAMEAPEKLTSLYYTVTVVYKGLQSVAARTNAVVLGSIIPPYTADFKAEDGFAGWTTIDANEDGEVWVGQSDGSVGISYNDYMDMDDWLFSPPIKMEAGKVYELVFTAKCFSPSYPERLEVKMGTNNLIEAMGKTVLPPTAITESYLTEGQTFVEKIVPDADGNYFIGFHGISDAGQFTLYLSDIQITTGVTSGAPGPSTNLKAVAGENGAHQCAITFNAPSKAMDGNDLTSLTKIELYRDETLIKTFDNPAPGSELAYTDFPEDGGHFTYTVVAYNEAGKGVEVSVNAFVGVNLPEAPKNVSISTTSTEGQVIVQWDAVTKDVDGLALNAAQVSYTVCRYENGWKPVTENLKGNTYSFQAVEAGSQEFVQMAVFAETSAGQGEGTPTEMIPVGTPYKGMTESFADATEHYIYAFNAIGEGSLDIYDDSIVEDMTSVTGDNGFMTLYSFYRNEGGTISTGLVSLENLENPGFTFYTFNIKGEADDANTIAVSIREFGSNQWNMLLQPTAINTLCRGVKDEWSKVTVPLTAYAGKTVQLRLTILTETYTYTFLDDMSVASIPGNDLGIFNISAPANVNTGENYNVEVQVVNEGAKTAQNYTIELYEDGILADSKTGETLESGNLNSVDFELTMSPIATKPIQLYAKVVYSGDEINSNNQSATLTVTPMISNLPTALELEGQSLTDGVELKWIEPNLEGGYAEQITDDFENGEAFAAHYGDWKFYDGDQAAVGGFQDLEIPGIEFGETKGSFWIWDNQEINANSTFDAHSGNKYLFALFSYDDSATDNWAISPELYGGEQTISFYAKSYSSSYPESIQIYYSTGSTNVSDFKAISGTLVNTVPSSWTQYTAKLPAGAKYFAIRSFAAASFMLMIDDVTYAPAGSVSDLEIAGYNIYRDGEKINQELIEETSYIDSEVTDGQTYNYTVTVVYTDKGESSGSNNLKITYKKSSIEGVSAAISVKVENGCIVIYNAEGAPITVSDLKGIMLFNGTGEIKTIIPLEKGIYIVKVDEKVYKVLVK